MMDVQNPGMLSLEPFMRDGAEAQPLFELEGAVTREDYRACMTVHLARQNRKIVWAFAGASLFLVAWGLVSWYQYSDASDLSLCVAGIMLLIFSLLQARIAAASAARLWGGPLEFLCRFFEGGFEIYQDHGMARRPYSDVFEAVYVRGALYLYVSKIRLYILPAEAFHGCAEGVIGLIERGSGKKVIRLDPEREE
jgi:hypothetical protein